MNARRPDLEGDSLAAFDGDDTYAASVSEFIGLPLPLGRRWPCVVPGCDPSACTCNLWRDKRDLWVYRHSIPMQLVDRDGKPVIRRSFALAEVYAAVKSGYPMWSLEGPELARWKVRSLLEFGILEAPEVELPPLPAALRAFKAEYDALRLLFTVRDFADPGRDEVPISWRFFARWRGGISHQRAGLAIQEFEKAGIIVHVGWEPGMFNRPTKTWRPGPTEGTHHGIPTL